VHSHCCHLCRTIGVNGVEIGEDIVHLTNHISRDALASNTPSAHVRVASSATMLHLGNILANKARHGEHKAGDVLLQNQINHIRRVKVTLRLADHKAGTHSQRRKDLEHVSIKTDGVAEHDVVSVGCREEAKQVKKGHSKQMLQERKFLF
jgi:hypothetical protein